MKDMDAKKKVLAEIMGLCDEADLAPFAEKKKASAALLMPPEGQPPEEEEREVEEEEEEGEGSITPEMKEKLLEMYAALKD